MDIATYNAANNKWWTKYFIRGAWKNVNPAVALCEKMARRLLWINYDPRPIVVSSELVIFVMAENTFPVSLTSLTFFVFFMAAGKLCNPQFNLTNWITIFVTVLTWTKHVQVHNSELTSASSSRRRESFIVKRDNVQTTVSSLYVQVVKANC